MFNVLEVFSHISMYESSVKVGREKLAGKMYMKNN